MTLSLFRALFDIAGLSACLLGKDGRVIIVSESMAHTLVVKPGDQIEIISSKGDEYSHCSVLSAEQEFRALVLSDSDFVCLVHSTEDRFDKNSELYSLAYSLRDVFAMPMERLMRDIGDFIIQVGIEEGMDEATKEQSRVIQRQTRALRQKSIDYWLLLAAATDMPKRGEDRITPDVFMKQVCSPFYGRLSVYLKVGKNLGVLYGSKKWLAAAFHSVVQHMHQQQAAKGILCELRQSDSEILITFQDVGMVAPGLMTEMESDMSKSWRLRSEMEIDLDLARRTIVLHGGSIRSCGEIGAMRYIVSLPTGAPGFGEYRKTIVELEQQQLYMKENIHG